MAATWDELRYVRGVPKLSAIAAADIRTRWAAGGVMQIELATEYGVNPSTVCRVLSGGIYNPAERTAWQSFADWARRRGYSEARIAAEEARVQPPTRHICEPGTACCAAVMGYDADRLAAD